MSEATDQLQAVFGASLTLRSLEELESAARMVRFRKDARLFASGTAAEQFIIVSSGRAKVQLSSRSGREIVLFRLGPGQCCALTASCLLTNSPYYAEGIAETDLEVVVIGSAAFNAALTSSPGLMRSLLSELAERIAGLTMLVDRRIGRDLNAELMELLLQRAGPDHKIDLSHKKIAEELGTVREVVSRKLKDLEKAGRIRIGRGSIMLLKD
jgi:CRP/FNR family transcriptional regulator